MPSRYRFNLFIVLQLIAELTFRLGHPHAQHIVGESMFHGKGVEKNIVS